MIADSVRGRAMRSTHWVAGLLACIVLPAASRIGGVGTFAWTMYSRPSEFRIEAIAFDALGSPRTLNPTALAEHAAPSAGALLGGADHWRSGPTISLRGHLVDLARYACSEEHAAAIQIVLHERNPDGPERLTNQRVACVP